MFDRFAKPPCADTLGWQLISADPATGIVRVRFAARPEFGNPGGTVQGGFLAAMLDDVLGSAVLVKSDGAFCCATIGLNVLFVAPVHIGTVIGTGRVVSMGRSIAFVSGELHDDTGALLASATASARLIPVDKLPSGGVVES
ncbi:PaaI family thioesterase [Sphingomonas qilianensis]|uniref:PaaI family thioesterase n=1 Tax=Sphingomonas qilianensis TaxID=1736690 RepID=UPI00362006FA